MENNDRCFCKTIKINQHYLDTLLIEAVRNNDKDFISELLVSGADPNMSTNTSDSKYCTVLHYGVGGGNIEIVKELISWGAKKYHRDFFGKSPLDWAREDENASIVEYLENCKCEVEGCTNNKYCDGDVCKEHFGVVTKPVKR